MAASFGILHTVSYQDEIHVSRQLLKRTNAVVSTGMASHLALERMIELDSDY